MSAEEAKDYGIVDHVVESTAGGSQSNLVVQKRRRLTPPSQPWPNPRA